MDKTTNNRQSRKVTDNTMDKTTNNDLEEGYRQYNGQNYKQRSRGRSQTIQWTKLQTTIIEEVYRQSSRSLFVVLSIVLSVTFLEIVGCSFVHCIVGRLQTIQWTKLQTTVNRGRLQTIQWTKLQTTISRKSLPRWWLFVVLSIVLSVTFLEIVVCSFVNCIVCSLPRDGCL
jgi:hypothetical protein